MLFFLSSYNFLVGCSLTWNMTGKREKLWAQESSRGIQDWRLSIFHLSAECNTKAHCGITLALLVIPIGHSRNNFLIIQWNFHASCNYLLIIIDLPTICFEAKHPSTSLIKAKGCLSCCRFLFDRQVES